MTIKRTPETYLKSVDPVLGRVIKRVVLAKHIPNRNYFHALVSAIISQQLSNKAANSIERKFVTLFKKRGGFPSPADVLALSTQKMRTAGLSGSKVSYIKNLARAVHKNHLDFARIHTFSDQEIIDVLIEIKGIGQWTAEMFLMFALGRKDIFSYGDLGLRNAIQKLYKLKVHPSKEKAAKIAAKWSPHRTLACRFLWASIDI